MFSHDSSTVRHFAMNIIIEVHKVEQLIQSTRPHNDHDRLNQQICPRIRTQARQA